jgi:hypothetical protein
MAGLTGKQRKDLSLIADSIQFFIMTKKPGKKFKCTNKRDSIRDIVSHPECFDYLFERIRNNFDLLDLNFNFISSEKEEEECEDSVAPLDGSSQLKNTRLIELTLSQGGRALNKKNKLKGYYRFYYEPGKDATYFVIDD